MDVIKIESIDSLIDTVHEIAASQSLEGLEESQVYDSGKISHSRPEGLLWFRGQLASLPLWPTLYRSNGMPDYERHMLRDLKLRAVGHMKREPRNDWDWLFMARHEGFNSRLLDWSESPLVSLYFALRENAEGADRVLWVLDPRNLNRMELDAKGATSIPVAGHPWTSKYLLPAAEFDETLDFNREKWLPKYPLAIRAPQLTSRSVAQSGVFTIHGYLEEPLEEIVRKNTSNGPSALTKLLVPWSAHQKLLRAIETLGITDSVLFPELGGIIEDLHRKYSKRSSQDPRGD